MLEEKGPTVETGCKGKKRGKASFLHAFPTAQKGGDGKPFLQSLVKAQQGEVVGLVFSLQSKSFPPNHLHVQRGAFSPFILAIKCAQRRADVPTLTEGGTLNLQWIYGPTPAVYFFIVQWSS